MVKVRGDKITVTNPENGKSYTRKAREYETPTLITSAVVDRRGNQFTILEALKSRPKEWRETSKSYIDSYFKSLKKEQERIQDLQEERRHIESGELDPRIEEELYDAYGEDADLEWQKDVVFKGDHYVLMTINTKYKVVIRQGKHSSIFATKTNAFWSAVVVASLVEEIYSSKVDILIKDGYNGVTLKVIGGWKAEPEQLAKLLDSRPDTSAKFPRNGSSFLNIRNPNLWKKARPAMYREEGASIFIFTR